MTYEPGRSSRFPNGMTLREGVAHAKAQIARRRKAMTPATRKLAGQGRGNDTEVAHVARGELVVPQALQNPEVLAVLSRAAAAYNVPLEMLSVGNAMNRINPHTGAPEFGVMDWISGLFGSKSAQAEMPHGDPNALTPEMDMHAARVTNMPINTGTSLPRPIDTQYLTTPHDLNAKMGRDFSNTKSYPNDPQFMRSAPYAPTRPAGVVGSIKQGLTDFGAELSHMAPFMLGKTQAEADAIMAERERIYDEGRQVAGRSGVDIPREAASLLTGGALGRLIRTTKLGKAGSETLTGAIDGGIEGAFEPTTNAYSWEKLGNIAQGAAEGARDGFLDDLQGKRRFPRKR